LWVAVAALLFVAGTYAAPLRIVYAPLCHQQEARSFALGEGHQAVCCRCSGLYWGGAAGIFAAWLMFAGGRWEPRPVWLLLAALPNVADAAAHWMGLPALPGLPRFIIALPLGFVAGLCLAYGINDLERSVRETQTIAEETHG
jgi:uncharacterized membrane protein